MENNLEIFDFAYDEEKNQMIHCIYDENGDLCKYHILDDKIAIQLSKYADIQADLRDSVMAIKKMIKIKKKRKVVGNEIVIMALHDFAVVKFIRCFNSSRGRKLSLDYKNVYKEDEILLKFYTNIFDLRNEEIAHSESFTNSLTLYFDTKSNWPMDLKFANLRRISGPQSISYKKLLRLVEYCQKHVASKREILFEKLLEILKADGAEFYSSKAKDIDRSSIIQTIYINGGFVDKNHAIPTLPTSD